MTTTTNTKQFPLGQVLSITNDRLVCEMGGVYEILNFITGDSLMTHQLPRGMRFAAPFILEAHPDLAITEEQNADLARRIKEAQSIKGNTMGAVGAWLSLLSLPMLVTIHSHEDAWLSIDPMSELAGMVGDNSKIITVGPSTTPEEVSAKISAQ